MSNDATCKTISIGTAQIRMHDKVNFHDVFSLLVKHSSIWVLLALIIIHGLELEHLDLNIAFLYGDLDKDIYMQQTIGLSS